MNGEPTPRVTLRDIARLAGVHYSTVSMALRNHPRLRRETIEKIQTLAQQMGYVPDAMLSSLVSYRHQRSAVRYRATLGWLTAFPTRDGWRQVRLFRENYEGAVAHAAELGYQLDTIWLAEPGMTSARVAAILKARGIVGIIFAPQPQPGPCLALPWEDFSPVTLGYSITEPVFHLASSDQYRCLRMGVTELLARGYRRLGLVMLAASNERVEHYWQAAWLVEQNNRPAGELLPPLFLEKWNEAAVRQWVAEQRPDAVLTKQPDLFRMQEQGLLAVPDLGLAQLTEPMVQQGHAGIHENPRQVGAAAVDMVVAMLRRNERGLPRLPRRLLLEGTWVEGSSVRPRPTVTSAP